MTVSFAASIAPIFRAHCQQACHGGAYQGNNTQVFNRLRGTTPGNTNCANTARVTPSNAANSLVIKKLSGTQTCGDKMPQVPMGSSSRNCSGTECVSQADIDLISTWINQGAINN